MITTLLSTLVFMQSAFAVNTITINGQTHTCPDGHTFQSINGQFTCTAPSASSTPAPVAPAAETPAPLVPQADNETITNNPISAAPLAEVYGPTLQCADGSLAQFINGSYHCNTTAATATPSFKDRIRHMHRSMYGSTGRRRGDRRAGITVVHSQNGVRSYFSCPAAHSASYINGIFSCTPTTGTTDTERAVTPEITTGTAPVVAAPTEEVVQPVLVETNPASGGNIASLNGQTFECDGHIQIRDDQAFCNGAAIEGTTTVGQ